MKMSNGEITIECDKFTKNIWERNGFEEVIEQTEESEESEEVIEQTEELTYAELKTLAKEKGINTHGMKKEEIIAAIGAIE